MENAEPYEVNDKEARQVTHYNIQEDRSSTAELTSMVPRNICWCHAKTLIISLPIEKHASSSGNKTKTR